MLDDEEEPYGANQERMKHGGVLVAGGVLHSTGFNGVQRRDLGHHGLITGGGQRGLRGGGPSLGHTWVSAYAQSSSPNAHQSTIQKHSGRLAEIFYIIDVRTW